MTLRAGGSGSHLGSEPPSVRPMATYVGLDPVHDIKWVVSDTTPIQLFAEHKIDALMGIAVEVQELQERKLGHVVDLGVTGPGRSISAACCRQRGLCRAPSDRYKARATRGA